MQTNIEISGLVCPVTKQPLTTVVNGRVMTDDEQISYPIVEGVPLLLGPEAITDLEWTRDLKAPQYAEAYAEMDFYNRVGRERADQIKANGNASASNSISMQHLYRIASLPADERSDFPNPSMLWACDNIDAASEVDCYRHIGSVRGRRILQIGGSGTTALLLLLAGAKEAILLTPMDGETRVALQNAELLGLVLRCVIGIGEEIPFEDNYADVVFVGGCVHHMRTEIAFKEMSRVLKPCGKFAAIEPWRAPGYTIGTKLFGKREENPFCTPLTADRVEPLTRHFSNTTRVHHGALTRYPSIVAQKAGLRLSVPRAEWVTRVDDAICDCIPLARGMGSAVALLATK